MKLNMTILLLSACVCAAAFAQTGESTGEDTFGRWRVSVGGAFNGGARSDLGMRNVPQPAAYVVSPYAASTRDAALANARSGHFDGNGFILPDDATGVDDWPMTENWMIPTRYYRPSDNCFHLENSYYEEEVVGSSVRRSDANDFDTDMTYGISAEVSRELWCHDEAFENRWGVDFAAAFSYFFQREVYSASGRATREDVVRTREGYYETVVDAEDSLYDYLEEPIDSPYHKFPINGMYGYGNSVCTFNAPQLRFPTINPIDRGSETYRTESATTCYSANGNYRELEMLFMFRPWYEITDWWRVYAEIGVGVSWGNFESDFSYGSAGVSEDFSQWDCYGVGGLGTMFRYGMFDLSIDFFGRFLRDDMDIDGRHVSGSIKRSDWGFRVMIGFDF